MEFFPVRLQEDFIRAQYITARHILIRHSTTQLDRICYSSFHLTIIKPKPKKIIEKRRLRARERKKEMKKGRKESIASQLNT